MVRIICDYFTIMPLKPCRRSTEYTLYSQEKDKTPLTECLVYEARLHQMVTLQSWGSGSVELHFIDINPRSTLTRSYSNF